MPVSLLIEGQYDRLDLPGNGFVQCMYKILKLFSDSWPEIKKWKSGEEAEIELLRNVFNLFSISEYGHWTKKLFLYFHLK